MSHTCESRRIPESLCPIWDEILIMQGIALYGNAPRSSTTIPEVTAEIYDHDEKVNTFSMTQNKSLF